MREVHRYAGTVGRASYGAKGPPIMGEGLLPGRRHAVHLSANEETAHRVGARRGTPVVLVVDAAAMHADGQLFTVSANGVWLVPAVPARYLRESRRS